MTKDSSKNIINIKQPAERSNQSYVEELKEMIEAAKELEKILEEESNTGAEEAPKMTTEDSGFVKNTKKKSQENKKGTKKSTKKA